MPYQTIPEKCQRMGNRWLCSFSLTLLPISPANLYWSLFVGLPGLASVPLNTTFLMASCDLITPPWYRRTSQLQLLVQNFCSATPVPVSPSRVAFRSIAVAPSLVGSICTLPPRACPCPSLYPLCPIFTTSVSLGLSVTCPLCACCAYRSDRIRGVPIQPQPYPAGPLERLLDVCLDVLYSRASFACVKFLLFVIYFDWDAINIASPCS
jgi:hypothetical protein